jgi:hypothetical protein
MVIVVSIRHLKAYFHFHQPFFLVRCKRKILCFLSVFQLLLGRFFVWVLSKDRIYTLYK